MRSTIAPVHARGLAVATSSSRVRYGRLEFWPGIRDTKTGGHLHLTKPARAVRLNHWRPAMGCAQ